MSGYDWEKQALRLERENADLRRQVDTAWAHINLVYRHLADHGIELGEQQLRDHALELRAIGCAQETEVADLEGFRKSVVLLVLAAEDALSAGEDVARILSVLTAGIRKANAKAKARPHLKEGRERAAAQVEEAMAVRKTLDVL